MAIFIVMIIGILIGLKWFPAKWNKINSAIQLVCTAVLIFSMGVSLGSRPDFINEVSTLGIQSLMYAVIPIVFSIIIVYFLTEIFLCKKDKGE